MPTGTRIKDIRKQKGLTQKQLGDMCGIADSNIRKYENGYQNPKIETLQKIATALGEPLSIFIDDELFDATTDDEENGTNHVIEILKKRTREIAENDALTKDEKVKILDDLITTHKLIIQENIDHVTVAKKQLLNFYFDELNMNGRDKALEHVEMLTKIPDYREDTIKDMQILEQESNKEPEPPYKDGPELEM